MTENKNYESVLDIISADEMDKIRKFAKEISTTPSCPDRFIEKKITYKKTADGKLIYTADKKPVIEKIEHIPQIDYIVYAIMYGREMGLQPLLSLKSITFFQGVPTLYGDAMMSLVMKSGLLVKYTYHYEGKFEEDNYKCVVTLRRKGLEADTVTEFSLDDAIRACLWVRNTKDQQKTPWYKYTKRMLLNRCRTYALREVFPDVLGGLSSYEEMQDVQNVMEADKPELEDMDNCKNSLLPMAELDFSQFQKNLEEAKSLKELEDVYSLVKDYDNSLTDQEQKDLSEIYRKVNNKFINNVNLEL